jgi:hypothetical protein
VVSFFRPPERSLARLENYGLKSTRQYYFLWPVFYPTHMPMEIFIVSNMR